MKKLDSSSSLSELMETNKLIIEQAIPTAEEISCISLHVFEKVYSDNKETLHNYGILMADLSKFYMLFKITQTIDGEILKEVKQFADAKVTHLQKEYGVTDLIKDTDIN